MFYISWIGRTYTPCWSQRAKSVLLSADILCDGVPLYTLIHDLRNSINEQNTHLYKNISLFLFLKGALCLLLAWEIDVETYTQREDFFLFHTFFWETEGANACNPLQAISSETSSTHLIGCVSLAQLPILCLCLNQTTWFSYHLVSFWLLPWVPNSK